jgi:hypothetical protein
MLTHVDARRACLAVQQRYRPTGRMLPMLLWIVREQRAQQRLQRGGVREDRLRVRGLDDSRESLRAPRGEPVVDAGAAAAEARRSHLGTFAIDDEQECPKAPPAPHVPLPRCGGGQGSALDVREDQGHG